MIGITFTLIGAATESFYTKRNYSKKRKVVYHPFSKPPSI
jgi:hypothetical protein